MLAMDENEDLWPRLVEMIDALVEHSKEAAQAVQKTASGLTLSAPVFYRWNPVLGCAVVEPSPQATEEDFSLAVKAASNAVGHFSVRTIPFNPEHDNPCEWIKVGYSEGIRRLGEYLQFFDTKNPEWWSHPSPVAAMAASSLLGAGLGYGAGRAVEGVFGNVLPGGAKPRRLLSYGGAALGAVPAGLWMLANRSVGRSFNDPALLGGPPAQQGILDPGGSFHMPDVEEMWKTSAAEMIHKRAELETMGAPAQQRAPSPYDVDIDAFGRTIYHTPAGPATAGAIYAASGMPGGLPQPGFVTPSQFANFALSAGGNAAVGALAGAALGRLSNADPSSLQSWRNTGALAGIVGTVLPRLFGW